jgi:hypothetical protein
VIYTAVVSNGGPDGAMGASLVVDLPSGIIPIHAGVQGRAGLVQAPAETDAPGTPSPASPRMRRRTTRVRAPKMTPPTMVR